MSSICVGLVALISATVARTGNPVGLVADALGEVVDDLWIG